MKRKKDYYKKPSRWKIKHTKQLNRSMAGNTILFVIMGICGVFMALPLVMILNNALKPLDELFRYPPQIFVRNPSLDNFSDLYVLMSSSWVPFTRYVLNTLIITGLGTVGHVLFASLAAYPLAKHDFPGKKFLFSMVVLSLMFSYNVTAIPNYMIISWLGINNTYLAVILPAFAYGLGLYLMKQFMEQIPDSLIESARLDGAGEFRIFFSIIMPNVKPAWLTLAIFQFQTLWANTGSGFLRSEQLKPLQYALYQIVAGGPARQGAGAVVQLIIAAIPITFFIICQSNVIETMTTSGMKDKQGEKKMPEKGMRKCIFAAAAAVAVLLSDIGGTAVYAGENVPYETYNYDYYEDIKYTPAAYVPDGTVTGDAIGCGNFSSPQDLNTDADGNVYIADTGNNRIVVTDAGFRLKTVIEGFLNDGKEDTFSSPNGVYISENGYLYVADTGNYRVVELDKDGNLIQIIENPQSDILGENYVFSPLKVAVDYADRIYVIAQNQFEGIMAFDAEGNFTGFTGTINVQITTAEIIWRKLSTKAQRAKQQLFIPTEFTGMEIDADGFVYATNVDAEGEQSVRRLNPSGEDVIQKGAAGVSGDLTWRLTGDYSGASRITDVVVRDKGIYSIIDSTRGRIFTYDHEGNLLYIFGGIGSQEGTFDTPTAIDTIGDEIIVLDGSKNLVDKYRATNYGSLINQAVGLRYDGDEVSAVECWKEVLKLDSNFELAYVGIGKSYLAAGENKKAMECFKTGNNRQYYSIAYKRYRNEILKENLAGYLTGALILIILLILWNKIGKKKWKERRASHV